MQAQTTNPRRIGAEAAIYAAECVKEIERKDSQPMGARQTWRRGFNAAHNYNTDTDTTGAAFDTAEDIYSEILADVTLDAELSGADAAEEIRERAENLVEVL